MDFNDKTLKCATCAKDFVFSAGEQMFFREKQFQNEPRHCKKCKAILGNARRRPETSVTCAECGRPTIVPFLPSNGRPVLCRACFDRAMRDASIRAGGIPSQPSQQVE
jgi:CxxC-x17-CxxC domain-containing protein